MAKKIKFAIIGMGYIGKRHADMINNDDNCELVAIVDTNKSIIDEYVKTIESVKNIRTHYDIESLLETDDYDVACICTPNGIHYEHSIKMLEHGKHIVVEKPIALSKTEAEHIVQASITNDKKVFCVMQNRYSPPSEWLKETVESGILGDIYMVQVNCYWNRDERYYLPKPWKGTQELDGGTLFTQFSHFIDIMYWVFGDITDIEGKFRDFNHQSMTEFEDSGFVNFNFVNGGMGVLNYSTSVYNSNLESSITIIAENGSIKIGGQYMNEVEICNIKDYEMPKLRESNPPNDYGYYKGSASNHHHVFENIVDVINNDGNITTTVMEGYKVVDIIERIYKHRDEYDFNSILYKKQ